MDDQSQKPLMNAQPAVPQLATPAAQAAAINQPAEPKLAVPDEAAMALLTINNLQSAGHTKTKLPTKLIIAVIALIVLVILASALVGGLKPGGSSSTNTGVGVPNQATPSGGRGTTDQINQDVKACSDPVNAVTAC